MGGGGGGGGGADDVSWCNVLWLFYMPVKTRMDASVR